MEDAAYKFVVVGDIGTGKTSLVKRYIGGTFKTSYTMTIGVDFGLNYTKDDANGPATKIQLWDISGIERFGNMTHVYYKNAHAVIIVYDVSRDSTFDAVMKWKNDIDQKIPLVDGKRIPCLLVGNKIDLKSDAYPSKTGEEMDKFAQDNGFISWAYTSAKNDTGFHAAIHELVTLLKESDK